MTGAVRTFVTHCSLVVRPISMWTGKPPTDSALTVRLQGFTRLPIRTSDGCYAFLDYPGRQCTLVVSSPYYLTTTMEIDLDSYETPAPVVDVMMRPNRQYPPPAAATGLRVRIVDKQGAPLGGAVVNASYSGKSRSAGHISLSTWSDERGHVVLPLRGLLPPSFTVKADVVYGKLKAQAEWQATSGDVVDLPDFQLKA